MTTTLKKILTLGLLALLPVISSANGNQSSFDGRHPWIEGVWDSTVTLQACGSNVTLRSFRALNSFEVTGALVATSEVAPPPSLGRWRWLGGRSFKAQFQYLRLGASGVFEGMTRVTRVIELAPDGRSFTGVVSTQLFDVADTVFAEGCGKEAATRVF
jgi:hypothetical protein